MGSLIASAALGDRKPLPCSLLSWTSVVIVERVTMAVRRTRKVGISVRRIRWNQEEAKWADRDVFIEGRGSLNIMFSGRAAFQKTA